MPALLSYRDTIKAVKSLLQIYGYSLKGNAPYVSAAHLRVILSCMTEMQNEIDSLSDELCHANMATVNDEISEVI